MYKLPPKKHKSVKVSITLPSDLLSEIKKISEETDSSVSFVIQIGMRQYLDYLGKDDDTEQ